MNYDSIQENTDPNGILIEKTTVLCPDGCERFELNLVGTDADCPVLIEDVFNVGDNNKISIPHDTIPSLVDALVLMYKEDLA